MADSSVAITAGSGTPIRVLTGLGAASADQQVMTLADSAGNLLGTTGAPVPVSLGAGSSTVGSIASISTSVVPGTAATNLGKARSGTAGTTDTGVAVLGLRAPTTPAVNASAVSAYSQVLLDAEGKLITAGSQDPVNSWQAPVGVASTSQTLLKAAGAAGIRNYITDLTVTSSATAATVVQIQDGSTTIWQAAVALNSPAVISFRTPLRGTAATAVNISCSAANQVYVSACGYLGI